MYQDPCRFDQGDLTICRNFPFVNQLMIKRKEENKNSQSHTFCSLMGISFLSRNVKNYQTAITNSSVCDDKTKRWGLSLL